MSCHQPHPFVKRRSLAIVVLAGALWPTFVSAAEEDKSAAAARFQEIATWLPQAFVPKGSISAFEEHASFAYLQGHLATHEPSGEDQPRDSHVRLVFLRPATLVVDVWPFEIKHRDIGKPTTVNTTEVQLVRGKKLARTVLVYHDPAQEPLSRAVSIRMEGNVCEVGIQESHRDFQLVLPLGRGLPARIAVRSTDGKTILRQRHLPAGIMPLGTEGMRLIEQWDSRYRGDSRPAWDKGFPSTHLKAALENDAIKPGRAVVLGCGTGTNAVFLAKQGFDVTAIDIAPTALHLAEEKARQEDVKVRWLLADVLAPPADLGKFDFVFDRGCYHGVRRINADGYVNTLKRLSRPGTRVLILAGNANEDRHYGPPRVKEEELRGDFSSDFEFVRLDTIRFDSIDPEQQAALAWSALLVRKMESASDSAP